MTFAFRRVFSVNFLYDFSSRQLKLCRLIKLSVEEFQENKILWKVFKLRENYVGWHKTVRLAVGRCYFHDVETLDGVIVFTEATRRYHDTGRIQHPFYRSRSKKSKVRCYPKLSSCQ